MFYTTHQHIVGIILQNSRKCMSVRIRRPGFFLKKSLNPTIPHASTLKAVWPSWLHLIILFEPGLIRLYISVYSFMRAQVLAFLFCLLSHCLVWFPDPPSKWRCSSFPLGGPTWSQKKGGCWNTFWLGAWDLNAELLCLTTYNAKILINNLN